MSGITHGARSGQALALGTRNVKQSLLKRMGMRQADLSWAGRETLDLYARNRAKLLTIDRWLETNDMIGPNGEPAAVMKIYWVSFNAAVRTLAELRSVIEQMAKEDARFDAALQSLASEGARIRQAREGNGA